MALSKGYHALLPGSGSYNAVDTCANRTDSGVHISHQLRAAASSDNSSLLPLCCAMGAPHLAYAAVCIALFHHYESM